VLASNEDADDLSKLLISSTSTTLLPSEIVEHPSQGGDHPIQRHQTQTAYLFPRRNASRMQAGKAIGPAESGPDRSLETAGV